MTKKSCGARCSRGSVQGVLRAPAEGEGGVAHRENLTAAASATFERSAGTVAQGIFICAYVGWSTSVGGERAAYCTDCTVVSERRRQTNFIVRKLHRGKPSHSVQWPRAPRLKVTLVDLNSTSSTYAKMYTLCLSRPLRWDPLRTCNLVANTAAVQLDGPTALPR